MVHYRPKSPQVLTRHSYLQAKIGHKVNQTRAAKPTASPLLAVQARFAISTCTARYGRYIPIRQVTGTRTVRYQAVPSKIDRQRPILKEIDCRRSIEEEKGKKKRKRKKEEEGNKEYLASAVLARLPSLPAGRLRTIAPVGRLRAVARGRFFSCARRQIEATSED
ncbi:hypothetical protein GW17_00032285 [Ensete ventricosum]|nr:hypothetical protein GW17_00032285 [Ensete ventricosum]